MHDSLRLHAVKFQLNKESGNGWTLHIENRYTNRHAGKAKINLIIRNNLFTKPCSVDLENHNNYRKMHIRE